MVLDNRQVVTLAYRGLIPMRVPAGARIECTRGRVWITHDGSGVDVVLEPGESYEASRRGGIVVQALREATFSVRNAAAAPGLRPSLEIIPVAARMIRARAAAPA